MKKILFRADAFPKIGTGDLLSLIYLSDFFSKNGWKCYFCTKKYSAALNIIESRSIEHIIWLDTDISLEEEITVIESVCERESITDIFYEITERPFDEYKMIKNLRHSAVNFDGRIPQGLFLVVNWFVEAEGLYNKSLHSNTIFLLGPENVILPPSFDKIKSNDRAYGMNSKKILIAMGGADEFDFTGSVVKILKETRTDFKLKVIVGAGYTKLDDLKKTLSDCGSEYEIKINVSDMFAEYLDCDFAIGAGGLTSSELVASRTPAILIAPYEHQVSRCEYFDKKGYCKYMGYGRNGLENFKKYIKNFSVDNIIPVKHDINFGSNQGIFEILQSVDAKR